MDYVFIAKILLVALSAVGGVSTWWWFKLQQDNQIEEIAEVIIKQQTGHDIDLSPMSKEDNT